jgi:RNA polymerase sporulation-specific sigma factor
VPRTFSEHLLLLRAQAGDYHAERLLITSHEPLARQICRGFFVANGDGGDLLQAARIGLWQAIHRWDPGRRVRFRTFAKVVMRREVMLLVTVSRTLNQGVLNGAFSIDAPAGAEGHSTGLSLGEALDVPAGEASPLEAVLLRERLALILAMLPVLSPHERRSLTMTLNGFSQIESGAMTGTGAKSVNNALQRARRKLTAAA